MRDRRHFKQILAIDPTTRGFSFALLERTGRLIDWGGKRAPSAGRNRRCAEAVAVLIRTHRPDVLVLEDCTAPGSRRCARVRALIRTLQSVAASHRIPLELVPPRYLREVCAGNPRATKHDVARALAERLPELARHVPPRRKPWMTEDGRTHIFDAVALAVAVLHRAERPHGNRGRP